MRQGFTLIQISLLLIAASLVLVTILPGLQTTLKSNNVTVIRLNDVLTALRTYQASHGRLPCPADATKPIGDANYGVEAASPGDTTNCTGGSPSANYSDATNHVALGMLPVKTMGLSNSYALDAYGRDITYAVDTSATALGWAAASLTGNITVTDNGTANTTVAALVSHGTDGHGAWIPLTGSSGTAVKLNTGSTDADQLTNAHVDSSFAAIASLKNFVKKIPTATFDDLMIYKSPLWTMNTIPASVPRIDSVTPPANGCYATGQAISFTVTYSQAVTVTNTPRLTLTIGAHTRYANYASGSGTTSLVFTYTVQGGDSAGAGITLANTVDPNDGSIMTGLAYAVRAVTPPVLTGVTVNACGSIMYVLDAANMRVQKFDKDGNYLGQFGWTQGCGNDQFYWPRQMAIDSDGNILIADEWCQRVEKLDGNDGHYLGQFGCYSCGNEAMGAPTGIAIDSQDNIWVSDPQWGLVKKYDKTGTYAGVTFNHSGAQDVFSYALAVDRNDNLWVSDYNAGPVWVLDHNGNVVTTIVTGPVSWTDSNSVLVKSYNFPGCCGDRTWTTAFDYLGNAYILDYSVFNVQKWDIGGNFLRFLDQYAAYDWNEITNDIEGNIWVSKNANGYVAKYDSNWNLIFTMGTNGSGDGQFGGGYYSQNYIVFKPYYNVWVDDALPTGATASTPGVYNFGYSLTNEAWNWVGSSPSPYSGSLAQQSPNTAEVHQAYFTGATSKLSVGTDTALFAYVYLDPTNPPTEIMLQFSANNGTDWYRAYWGANSIPWGVDGTTTRRYMGALPPTGRWVRLTVPAALLGLEGSSLDCLAFTLYGGKAAWDKAGVVE